MPRPEKKQVVRLISLTLSERDLSIALVMLKECALRNPEVSRHYDIHLHQWQKRYGNLGAPGTVDGLPLDELVDALDPEHTDVVGCSMYVWNHAFMLEVSRRLKARNPRLTVLFGGIQATGYGSRLLEENPWIDYVLKGEAELTFPQFLQARLDGDVAQVPNLCHRHEDGVCTNTPTDPRAARRSLCVSSIEDLPLPFENRDYLDFLDNVDAPVTAQFETERGCPLSCAFCSWGNGQVVRRRRREDVERGLATLLDHPNVRAVYLVDANPFLDNDKGLWLTDFLLQHNRAGKPVYFELNPEYIRDPRVIDNLARLQGDEMAFGLQSTSEQTLKRCRRRFNREQYARNVQRLRALNAEANIKFSLILGLPGDTYESFLDSLEFAIGLTPSDVYVHDLLVLPGSAMYADPTSFGLQIEPHPPHRVTHNETFPQEDYQRAKRLGFYVKLMHKFPEVRDVMRGLHARTGSSHVSLYGEFADLLEDHGLEGTPGRFVASVPTSEFDYWTDRFLSCPDRRQQVWALLSAFRQNAEPAASAPSPGADNRAHNAA